MKSNLKITKLFLNRWHAFIWTAKPKQNVYNVKFVQVSHGKLPSYWQPTLLNLICVFVLFISI